MIKDGWGINQFIYKGVEVCVVKNEILIIQIIDSSDLKCIKEESIAKPQNWL